MFLNSISTFQLNLISLLLLSVREDRIYLQADGMVMTLGCCSSSCILVSYTLFAVMPCSFLSMASLPPFPCSAHLSHKENQLNFIQYYISYI